jgi:hypothetical protein
MAPIDMGAAKAQHGGETNGTGQAQASPRQAPQQPPLPVFLSADDFTAGYRPRRPLIRAWDMKRGWLYSFTAPTGGAKTAIALAEAIELAQQGYRVVFLAGENPDDVRARVILMQAMLGLEQLPATLRFVDRTFNLADNIDHVRQQVEIMVGADFIVIDTSPAFQVASGGLEENSNPEAIRWAQRLRELTRLQGTPSVLALCHPIKRPQSIEECLPRGGGGFLAEVDGNYASWCAGEDDNDKFFELRWMGKFRGHFSPIPYHIQRATCDRLVDADGNPVFSVWARRCDDGQTERAATEQAEEENALLIAMADYPGKSTTAWAKLLDWQYSSGLPYKEKVRRTLKRLAAHRLVRPGRGGQWQLLDAGKKEAKRVAEKVRNEAL